MTIVGHIAAGRIIGQQVESPLAAFLLAVAGHAAMDMALPEYMMWPIGSNLALLLWEGLASVGLLRGMSETELAGVLGQLAPDIVDGIYSLLNPGAWQRGELICPWHRARKQNNMSWPLTFAVEAILIVLALWRGHGEMR